jgi:Arf-GAP/SH3 domain/ANK repeat/PH domain-containing protein
MFNAAGLRGRVLNLALHHQHARIYSHNLRTRYGAVEACSAAAAMQFLTMAHFADGARLFTYVLTLDGMLRFTETGKEFGVDLLSKHTMHSDVNVYIAYSGEFFIRRFAPSSSSPSSPSSPHSPAPDTDPSPADFELVIDNDSGTYRPSAFLLPQLAAFLAANLPGLHITARDCADEGLQREKREQREMKRRAGQGRRLVQGVVVKSHGEGGWSEGEG